MVMPERGHIEAVGFYLGVFARTCRWVITVGPRVLWLSLVPFAFEKAYRYYITISDTVCPLICFNRTELALS